MSSLTDKERIALDEMFISMYNKRPLVGKNRHFLLLSKSLKVSKSVINRKNIEKISHFFTKILKKKKKLS